jgi:hypothetical protein
MQEELLRRLQKAVVAAVAYVSIRQHSRCRRSCCDAYKKQLLQQLHTSAYVSIAVAYVSIAVAGGVVATPTKSI